MAWKGLLESGTTEKMESAIECCGLQRKHMCGSKSSRDRAGQDGAVVDTVPVFCEVEQNGKQKIEGRKDATSRLGTASFLLVEF
jgi:hypothetical protein